MLGGRLCWWPSSETALGRFLVLAMVGTHIAGPPFAKLDQHWTKIGTLNMNMNIALRRFLHNHGNIATEESPKPYSYFE